MTRLLPLTRIEAYVLRQTLLSLAGALGIIAGMVMLIDFVEISRTLGAQADVRAFHLLWLMLMKSPMVILQLLPFVFLFGTLAAFVSLNRRSELVAMRAAGVSAWRFVFPAAVAALVIGVVTVSVLSPAASWMDGVWRSERTRLTTSASVVSADDPRAVWLREGDGQRQMIIRATSRDPSTGTLSDVSFFIYASPPGGTPVFSERIDAATAALGPGRWRLTEAVGASTGERATRYATLDLPSSLRPSEAFQQFMAPASTPFWSMPGQIARIENAGFSATAYHLRLQQLLASPLMYAAMSLLAAAFSLRLLRLGDLALMSVSAVALGFLFFFVNQFASAMGSAEVIPPVLAAWLPPVLTALSAFTLLFYTEDG